MARTPGVLRVTREIVLDKLSVMQLMRGWRGMPCFAGQAAFMSMVPTTAIVVITLVLLRQTDLP